jgi:adenylate cyclase
VVDCDNLVVAEADKRTPGATGNGERYRCPGALSTGESGATPAAAAWPEPRLQGQPERRMGKEIERKYLVDLASWKPQGGGVHYKQGYLNSQKERVVRVRIEGDRAKLTIKGPSQGVTRSEFEYAIPVADAALLLDNLCEQPLIDKHRHKEIHGGKTWEIDVFHGDNEGLVVAEIELSAEDEAFALPAWAGREVSSDPRYFNSNLLRNPFKSWPPG